MSQGRESFKPPGFRGVFEGLGRKRHGLIHADAHPCSNAGHDPAYRSDRLGLNPARSVGYSFLPMGSRAVWLVSLACSAAVIAVAWGGAGARSPRRAKHRARVAQPATVIDARRWPGDAHHLTPVKASFPTGYGVIKVVIDPGHGAPNNHGNSSCFCIEEQDAMLDLADALRGRLEATGHVEVRLSRERGLPSDYDGRIVDAVAWGAQAFISLHSDVRGTIGRWSPDAGQTCQVASDAPGFAVLYSDEGDPPLSDMRALLGQSVARRMIESGFLPYGGVEYRSNYAADGEPGVFIDRHSAEQRIFILRRATIPSILVETHNALDPREVRRWGTRETLDAFAAALNSALVDVLVSPH